MILTKEVSITINNKNKKHFESKGYSCTYGEQKIVKLEDVTPGCSVIITVQCCNCESIKDIRYYDYNKITQHNTTSYYCKNCKNIKAEKTNQEKYGVKNVFQSEDIKQKIKDTCLEKYGVDHHLKNADIKLKSVETSRKKYNTDHPLQNKDILNKQQQTNLIKYGSTTTLLNDDVIAKIKHTNIEKFGCENPMSNTEIKDRVQQSKLENIIKKFHKYNILSIQKTTYTLKCDCGQDHTFEISSDLFRNRVKLQTILCTRCHTLEETSSGLEIQLRNFIHDNYTGNIRYNDRQLGKELDIYLPDLKLAFEFNGVYYHSEVFKPNSYHYDKMELCEKNQIQLIYIWEDDWLYQREIVQSRILNLLGQTPNRIYARQCIIQEIDHSTMEEFLNLNHIQGSLAAKIRLGLYYNNILVSVMTFGKLRTALGFKDNTSQTFEMLRFCNKIHTSVVGGSSKLFTYFIKNYTWDKIISYADRSWSIGNLYHKLGFTFEKKTVPNYYYVVDHLRKHRFSFRKNILVQNGADPLKTEHEIMSDQKIYRIYDAGSLKFVYLK